jgi:hypothetical protein
MKFANMLGKALNKTINNPVANAAATESSSKALGNNAVSGGLTAGGVVQGMAKGAKGGAAAYGGTVALDAAHQLGMHMTGQKNMQDVDNENRQQVSQGYGQNVAENLSSPGQAMFQMGREYTGMAHDVQGAYDAQQKTNRMQQQRKYNRPIGQDYVDSSNQLNALFKKSLLQ